MRTKEKQEELDNMTLEEKIERTNIKNMYKRDIVIKSYKHRILCKNEYPHSERGGDQMVLRFKEIWKHWIGKREDLLNIISERAELWYYITLHPKQDQSCSFREHRHIYKIYN